MNPAAPSPAIESTDPGRGRAARSVLTWTTGLGATGLVAFAGFLATPYLVRWLGDAQWGAWTVIGEWLGYLGLSQLALGPGAMTVFLLRAHTRGEHLSLTATAKRGLRLYLIAALLLAPLGLALAWWAPPTLHAGPSLLPRLRWAVGIAAFGGLALTPPLLFRSVLETVQRGYLVRAALLIQALTITALSLWWTWRGWGIAGMAAASVVGMTLGASLWIVWARPWLPRWRSTPPAAIPSREIWHINGPLLVALAGNQINVLTDNTVVGLRLGAAAVTGFALTQSLLLLAGTQLTEIGAVSWAAMGDLRARNDGRMAQRIVELCATVLGVGMVLMATLAAFNRPFVTLWVGARHYDGGALSLATAASLVVFSFICFFSWLLDTQGDTRRRMWVSSIGSGINLGLSWWLARRWGPAGVAFGTLAAYLATDAWFLPYLAVRLYGVPARELVRALCNAGLRGGAWAGGVYLAFGWVRFLTTWPRLIAALAAIGAAAAAYCWYVVLRHEDRAAWKGRWSGLRPAA